MHEYGNLTVDFKNYYKMLKQSLDWLFFFIFFMSFLKEIRFFVSLPHMCHAAASFGSPFRSILFGRRRFLRGHVRYLMTSWVRDALDIRRSPGLGMSSPLHPLRRHHLLGEM